MVEGEGVEVVEGAGEPWLPAGGEELSCLRKVFQLTPYLVIATEYKNYCVVIVHLVWIMPHAKVSIKFDLIFVGL